jgi:hypothetical protein
MYRIPIYQLDPPARLRLFLKFRSPLLNLRLHQE